MNDMTAALKTAGVPVKPQTKRIWEHLKENGPCAVFRLASALNIPIASTQAAIGSMLRRKMIEKAPTISPEGGLRMHSTYQARGRVYALLPEPPKKLAPKSAPKVPAVVTPPRDPNAFDVDAFIDPLTIRQAREVYAALGRVFA